MKVTMGDTCSRAAVVVMVVSFKYAVDVTTAKEIIVLIPNRGLFSVSVNEAAAVVCIWKCKTLALF